MPLRKITKNIAESYSVVLAAVILFYALFYHFVFPFLPMVITCSIGSILMLLSIPIDRRFKRPSLTSNYMISVGYSMVVASCYFIDGKTASSMFYLALGPLLAGFSQTRFIIFWCLISISIYLGVHWTDTHNLIHPVRLESNIRSLFALTDVIGLTLIVSSITAIFAINRKKQFENIQEKHAQIESLVRVIAHDIANPLNLISFSMGLAAKRGLNEDLQNRIKKGINSIQAIIHQTKNLQALNAGKTPVNINQGVSLRELVEHTLVVFEEQLTKKQIQVSYSTVRADLKVQVDPQIFQTQILNNILSNAIKFSHENGTIEIRTQAGPNGQNNRVSLVIADHGVGIPKETLDSIFKVTKLQSQSGTQGEKGTGFGLTIVKQYLEHMDGSIEIQSKHDPANIADTGTTITLTVKKAA